MTLKPSSNYKMDKQIKRMLSGMHLDPEFKTWYKHKIIQCDLENELKSKRKHKEETTPE